MAKMLAYSHVLFSLLSFLFQPLPIFALQNISDTRMLNRTQSVLRGLVTRVRFLTILCLVVEAQHIAFGSLVWFNTICNSSIDLLLFVHSPTVAFVL